MSQIFLKRSLVFPFLLFSSVSLHWSPREAFSSLLAVLWNSTFKWVSFLFSFAFCFSFLSYLYGLLRQPFCLFGFLFLGDDFDHHLTNLLHSSSGTLSIRSNGFKIGKGVCQGYILLPSLFNLCAEYILWNAGLEEAKLESRLSGEIAITSDMRMTPPLWQKMKN